MSNTKMWVDPDKGVLLQSPLGLDTSLDAFNSAVLSLGVSQYTEVQLVVERTVGRTEEVSHWGDFEFVGPDSDILSMELRLTPGEEVRPPIEASFCIPGVGAYTPRKAPFEFQDGAFDILIWGRELGVKGETPVEVVIGDGESLETVPSTWGMFPRLLSKNEPITSLEVRLTPGVPVPRSGPVGSSVSSRFDRDDVV